MKFKRVTKLLACVLSVSMCTVPVFASGTEWKEITDTEEKKVEVDFGVNNPVLKVKVPTRLDLKVNPLYDSSATNKVQSFKVASKEFVISNNTSDNSTGTAQGVDLICTASATITEPGENVMISYNTVNTQAGDTRKLAHLALTAASSSPVTESQNAYAGQKETVTGVGSRLQVEVDGPTITNDVITGAGYGAFAITGEATTEADWSSSDLKVALTYKIRPSQETPLNSPAVAAVTAQSSNNLASGSGTQIAASSVLSKTTLGTATVTAILVHSPEGAFPDYLLEKSALKITEDATGYTVAIPKEDPGLSYLASNFLNKTQDLLIGLSDGRIIATK